MADGIEVKVDDRAARLKLERLTPEIRAELKAAIPPLIRHLADLVNSKLDTELASRTSLSVAQEVHDTTNELYGVARLESSKNPLLPLWLEEGTASHWVEPVNAKALHWQEGGEDFFSKGHMVRGIGPYKFMKRSFDEFQPDIVRELQDAASRGARRVE